MNRRAILSVACMSLLMSTSNDIRSANASTTSDFLPSDYVAGAWLIYRDKFVEADGRVVDGRNNGISHSEGQGYGLVMSVAADELHDFERIWDWTRNNLYVRGDRLAAWKWDPAITPNISDKNNATDGDLLIAWALSQAASKWNISEYADEAGRIIDSIVEFAVVDSKYGKLLMPGGAGFGVDDRADGPVINLSYWIFPAINDLGKTYPNFPAGELIKSGLNLIRMGRFGEARLPADWISVNELGLQPAAGYPITFGYDAIRIPLYVAWLSRDYPDIIEIFDDIWKNSNPPGVFVIDLQSATPMSPMQDPGYAAVAALASCSVGRGDRANRITTYNPTDYYPSTLHILSLVALTERYPECLPNLQ